jgi:hypothetical protein
MSRTAEQLSPDFSDYRMSKGLGRVMYGMGRGPDVAVRCEEFRATPALESPAFPERLDRDVTDRDVRAE